MPSVREFFVTEAGDYISRLAELVQKQDGVDLDELQRLCRGLRGSAQLAREDRVHRVARALEGTVRALAGGALSWGEQLRDKAAQTLEDLHYLVAGAETEREAEARVALALARLHGLGAGAAPAAPPPAAALAGAAPEFRAFAAAECAGVRAELSAALSKLEREPRDREPLKAILRRQRALLGAAQLDAIPAVAETIRGLDDITRLVARTNAGVEGEWLEFYRVARDVLGVVSPALTAGQEAPAVQALGRLRGLRDRLLASSAAEEKRPPRAPGVPGTTETTEELPVEVVNFFRTEARAILGRIERMAGELSGAALDRQGHLRRELRAAFTALRDTATTFGFAAAAELADGALNRIPFATGPELLTAVHELHGVITGEPVPAAVPPAPPAVTPTRAAASAAAPAGDDVVPIERLCYRGEAALRRALELQPALTAARPGDAAWRETVQELFDLIRLGMA